MTILQYPTPIERDAIVPMWSRVQPFIESALYHNQGELTLLDVLNGLIEGVFHLIVLTDSQDTIQCVAVTEFISYPQYDSLRIILLAGSKSKEWDDRLDVVMVRWAQTNDVTRIEALCRPALSKVLRPWGYTQAYVVMTKLVDSLH